jgi:hypothetical protein
MHKKCIEEERFRRASTIDHDAEKGAGSSASEVSLAVVERHLRAAADRQR